MPRYFFDIADGVSTFDITGNEFADVHSARDAALRTLLQSARDEIGRDKRFEVVVLMRDEGCRTSLRAALAIPANWLVDLAE